MFALPRRQYRMRQLQTNPLLNVSSKRSLFHCGLFFSLCGGFVFAAATRLVVIGVLFWFSIVFQWLIGCGISVFLHTPCKHPCTSSRGVVVKACIESFFSSQENREHTKSLKPCYQSDNKILIYCKMLKWPKMVQTEITLIFETTSIK
jgi:hypothetical protein